MGSRIKPWVMPFWQDGKARIGTLLVIAFLLLAIFAPLIARYAPSYNGFGSMLSPSSAHIMGTTQDGQDVFSQFVYGARTSLLVGAIAGLLSTFVSLIIGLLAGYLPGVVDETLSYLINIFLVMPGFPLMIVLASYSPVKGIWLIIFVIIVTSWAWGARVLRSQVQTLRSRDYVTAAWFAGESVSRIVWREIMPNMLSLVAASFLGAALSAILSEAGLEFLGLGDPNIVSWGTMLYWAQNSGALMQGDWVWMLMPGLGIALLGTALALMNFGVDQLTNPRLRRR